MGAFRLGRCDTAGGVTEIRRLERAGSGRYPVDSRTLSWQSGAVVIGAVAAYAQVMASRHLHIEIDREDDGRWIADVTELPGVMVYGGTREEAVRAAEALALRVMADRLDHGEALPVAVDLFAVAP